MNTAAPTDKTIWLTVGIAAYNVEEYIGKSIGSVLDQIDDRVTVIIVNDGSSDGTLRRIHEAIESRDERQQSRTRVIDQENGGLSEVRNVTLENTTTPYITFLDGDDYWLDEYYQSILALIGDVDRPNADIIEYNALKHREQEGTEHVEYTTLDINALGDYNGRLDPERLRKIFERALWYTWARIYSTKLFKGLAFTKNITFEDMMLTPQLYLRADRIITTDKPLIAYRVNFQGLVVNATRKTLDDVEFIIRSHLELSRHQQDSFKRQMLVLLACQSALYYKIASNNVKGYVASIPDIKRVLATIRPHKKESGVTLPLKTRLLFTSPTASNFYTYLKTRRNGSG